MRSMTSLQQYSNIQLAIQSVASVTKAMSSSRSIKATFKEFESIRMCRVSVNSKKKVFVHRYQFIIIGDFQSTLVLMPH